MTTLTVSVGLIRPRAVRTLLQAACFAAALLAWTLVARSDIVSDLVFPDPSAIASSLRDLVGTEVFWTSVRQTTQSAVIGLGAALLVGIPAGLLTGTYPVAERMTRLTVDVGRSFPIVALLPVFLLIMGATARMESTVIFLACVFPLFLQAQYGARDVSQTIKETARGYRIERLLRFRKVILPSAVPSIMTGLRIAATTSVLVAVGVEILTATPGLGNRLASAQLDGDSATAFAYVFTAACIGFAVNRCCEAAEQHFLRWRPTEAR